VRINQFARLVAVVNVLKAPSPFEGQYLNVYFQSSSDDGQSWTDFACVSHNNTSSPGGATAPATFYVPLSTVAGGPTALGTLSDGSLANGTNVQGPIGDRIRIKYYAWFGGPTPATGTYAFQAYLMHQ
jgi:hypothetical protein